MNQREAKRVAHEMVGALLIENFPASAITDTPDQKRITKALIEISNYHTNFVPTPNEPDPNQLSLEQQWD